MGVLIRAQGLVGPRVSEPVPGVNSASAQGAGPPLRSARDGDQGPQLPDLQCRPAAQRRRATGRRDLLHLLRGALPAPGQAQERRKRRTSTWRKRITRQAERAASRRRAKFAQAGARSEPQASEVHSGRERAASRRRAYSDRSERRRAFTQAGSAQRAAGEQSQAELDQAVLHLAQAGCAAVAVGEQRARRGPRDREVGIVPRDRELGLRVVGLRALVLDLRHLAESPGSRARDPAARRAARSPRP